MPSIKTAISVERPVFEQMEILAKNLNVSRSRLFTMAAQEFIERRKNLEILNSLNEAYGDLPETEPIVAKMLSKHSQLVQDQW